MTCTFCITEDHFDVMTQAQAVELLRTLKKEGCTNVVLGGGEPLEWPGDLSALAQEAKRLGFLVQLGTNGVDLFKNYHLLEDIDRVVLPLESAHADIHNTIRFYKNTHHQLVVEVLDKLRNAHKSVTLSTIVTRVNKDELPSLAVFLSAVNAPRPFIHAWHLYKFIPLGRGGKPNAGTLEITDGEYRDACHAVKTMGLPFDVYQRRDMYHSRTVDFFWYEGGHLKRASKNGPVADPKT